jgi:hypothetical protein
VHAATRSNNTSAKDLNKRDPVTADTVTGKTPNPYKELNIMTTQSQSQAAVKLTAKLKKTQAAAKRWQTRMKRAANQLDKLLKQERRLVALLAALPTTPVAEQTEPKVITPQDPARSVPSAQEPPPVVPQNSGGSPPTDDDGGIPAFLRRTPLSETAKQILREEAARKAERARMRAKAKAAAKKAALTGETRKMPLSGKAAAAFIRQGK